MSTNSFDDYIRLVSQDLIERHGHSWRLLPANDRLVSLDCPYCECVVFFLHNDSIDEVLRLGRTYYDSNFCRDLELVACAQYLAMKSVREIHSS